MPSRAATIGGEAAVRVAENQHAIGPLPRAASTPTPAMICARPARRSVLASDAEVDVRLRGRRARGRRRSLEARIVVLPGVHERRARSARSSSGITRLRRMISGRVPKHRDDLHAGTSRASRRPHRLPSSARSAVGSRRRLGRTSTRSASAGTIGSRAPQLRQHRTDHVIARRARSCGSTPLPTP